MAICKFEVFSFMNCENKTAYVDFVEKFNNVDTKIRIFETKTHIFIYVNQYPKQMHLYNEYLKNNIKKHIKRKEIVCKCNLTNYEALNPITKMISEILINKYN